MYVSYSVNISAKQPLSVQDEPCWLAIVLPDQACGLVVDLEGVILAI